jgi:hypothetical protein
VRIIARSGQGELELISKIIEKSFSLAGHYVWAINIPHIAQLSPVSKILLSAIHKNFISFCAVLDLTRQGLYGPARVILRHIYEGLVIAKFCSLSSNRKVFEQWENGDYVRFTNDVLNRIAIPDPDPFRKLWEVLCAFTHATVYSQQATLDAKKNRVEIVLTFQITRALLECNYHLLIQHFTTPSIRYFEKRYGAGHKVPKLKNDIRYLFCHSRKHMFPPFKKFVFTYRRTRVLK